VLVLGDANGAISKRGLEVLQPCIGRLENVPIGVQFAGRFGDEATLFRLAAQLEQARPWAGRWPTL